LDSAVVQMARRHFGFDGNATVADGRRYLQQSRAKWDLILVDAFLGGNRPWQLFTREAFALYRSHLRQGGAVVLNLIGSHLDPAQRPALAAVAAAAEAEFTHVEVYPDPWVEDE
jgi:spermidine synthase